MMRYNLDEDFYWKINLRPPSVAPNHVNFFKKKKKQLSTCNIRATNRIISAMEIINRSNDNYSLGVFVDKTMFIACYHGLYIFSR